MRLAYVVEEYPELDVHGLVCDFEAHLERTPTTSEAGPRLLAMTASRPIRDRALAKAEPMAPAPMIPMVATRFAP